MIPSLDNSRNYKVCAVCNEQKFSISFPRVKNPFFPDGYSSICTECLQNEITKNEDEFWNVADKYCQILDVPFEPGRLIDFAQKEPTNFFGTYCNFYINDDYKGIDWSFYNKEYKRLEEANLLEEKLPKLKEEKERQLAEIWGKNYTFDDLKYLEDLFQGIIKYQNVVGAKAINETRQLCKISFLIEEAIQGAETKELSNLISSYDKLSVGLGFSEKGNYDPDNFESVGEIFSYLEMTGWINPFFNSVPKDIVDRTIQNIQNSNRQLYIGETNISEEITKRIENLQIAADLEKEREDRFIEDSLKYLEEDYDTSDEYSEADWAEIEADVYGGQNEKFRL